jgi:outer membrane immunogenic protein
MNKFLLAATFLVLDVVSVSAADLPARQYSKAPAIVADPWTGWYLGASAGGR